MLKIPPTHMDTALTKNLLKVGFPREHQGKVRDSHYVDDYRLLPLATDRLSIFDFVLPCTIPDKGKILTALTVFWFKGVLKDEPNHFIASGKEMYEYVRLPQSTELQSRAILVLRLEMLMYELIVRAHLTGSGLKDYLRTGSVCGHNLPEGLHDGVQLDPFLFTPSTKADVGHDENINYRVVEAKHGKTVEEWVLRVFAKVYDFCAQRGIILADTKLEGGLGVLGDEVFTPDSSRFWKYAEWEAAQRQKKSPPSYDKDVVRNWGKTVITPFLDAKNEQIIGLGNLDPSNSRHVAFVHSLAVPQDVLEETSARYHEILSLLTGMTLEQALRDIVGAQ